MANNSAFYSNGKRGSAPHPSSSAPAEGTFKWRLAGPQTHVVIRDGRADTIKIPIQRRVLLNWSQAGRDQLAARSREKADFGAKSFILPDWANEEGIRWLLEWMNEKCKAEDDDDHLRTKQQAAERDIKPNSAVRIPDSDNLAFIMKLHQAAVAFQLPPAINHINAVLLNTLKERPMDAFEMKLFWELFGSGPPRATMHRVLDAQTDHMMAGTPGDYEAIEALAEHYADLQMLLYNKCESKPKDIASAKPVENEQNLQRRDSALQSSSENEAPN